MLSFLSTVVPPLLMGVASSAAVFLLLSERGRYRLAPWRASSGAPAGDDDLVFLGRTMLSGPASWERMLRAHRGQADDWAQFIDIVSAYLPDAAKAIGGPRALAGQTLEGEDAGLTARQERSVVAIALHGRLRRLDPDADRAKADADLLRRATLSSGTLVWRETEEGAITWVNDAYLNAVKALAPEDAETTWPPPRLFEAEHLRQARLASGAKRTPLRQGLRHTGWHRVTGQGAQGETLFTAIPIDGEIEAEALLRDHTRGLAKAVEGLSVGLAIFGRNRRLAMSNPALSRLTTLPEDYLASRPTLAGFLDSLRDARVMPEPRNYPGWRLQMAELEAAAAEDAYRATWSQTNGQTYRVTGHPHADGALVFFFEDISSEVSLTRRFRSEIELGQAVIDGFDDAIAVFSPNGDLSAVNRAYGELWTDGAPDPTVTDAMRTWMSRTAPTPIWGELRDFISLAGDRTEWSATARMRDGRSLDCRVTPIDGGATLARFRLSPPGRTGIAGEVLKRA